MSYLGNTPQTATKVVFRYIATAGQTTFSGVDTQGISLSFNQTNYDIYVNGVLLDKVLDVSSANGSQVVLSAGVMLNDVVVIVAYGLYQFADVLSKSGNLSGIANTAASLTNLGFSADSSSIAQAANFAAIRTLLQSEARIRQIAYGGDGTTRSGTSTTSGGTTYTAFFNVTPTSNTSSLLVFGFMNIAVTRSGTSSGGQIIPMYYDGSAYQAAPNGTTGTVTAVIGGATSILKQGNMTVSCLLTQSHLRSDLSIWTLAGRGNVFYSTPDCTMDCRTNRWIGIEYEP